MPVIAVVVAESHEIVRVGIRAVLAQSRVCRLVGEAGDVAGLLSVLRGAGPHVVVLDAVLLRRRGVALVDQVLAACRRACPRIVITAAAGDEELVLDAVRAGAAGSVSKEVSPRVLVEEIVQVAGGKLRLPQWAVRRLVDAHRRGLLPVGKPAAALTRLTRREAEVVRLVAAGRSNADIARVFVVSESTVKTHLHRAMRKLDVSSRSEMVIFAYRNGIAWPSGARD
ncbi:response regulator transcription factor [Amycolatopsis sp. NPDC051716]|jgi:DNA-binding NarL/FixJ family response regulator|uniref:response regulator transcription factor n=1 Tax=Amycolatopsis sp. NPDC051716 TaxID=3155804 RepID=UPI0034431E81